MAINLLTQYPGRVTASDANYTYGSSKNESVPGSSNDGLPHELARSNDLIGFQQALLRLASIVPSGSAETQLVSEYLQALVELASGRAVFYDASTSALNAHVLTLQSNQQGPRSYYHGMKAEYFAQIANTGAVTVDVNGLGVKDLWANYAVLTGDEIRNGEKISIEYNAPGDRFYIIGGAIDAAQKGLVMLPTQIEVGLGFAVNVWVTISEAILATRRAKYALIRVHGSTSTLSTLLDIVNITSVYARQTGSGLAVGNSTILDSQRIDMNNDGVAQTANTLITAETVVKLDASGDFDVQVASSGGAATLRHVQLLGYYL